MQTIEYIIGIAFLFIAVWIVLSCIVSSLRWKISAPLLGILGGSLMIFGAYVLVFRDSTPEVNLEGLAVPSFATSTVLLEAIKESEIE